MTEGLSEGRCGRFSEDLSAFADHTLPPKRWQQVGYHVAGCPACREEVDAIKRVCSRLSGSCAAPTTSTPESLAVRLERIAGGASHAPLYMAAGAPGELPSRRRERNRRLRQGGIAGLGALATMFVLALMLAPDPPTVENPVHMAREEYSLSITSISINETIGAVLLAHERGAQLSEPVTQRARTGIVGSPFEISAEAAAEALSQSIAADLTYSGTQRVWISDGQGAFYANDVRVDEVAGEGSTLSVLDARGDEFVSWFVPSSSCCSSSSPTGWTFFEYEGRDQVAGRWAKVIEARDVDNHTVSKWWVDTANGLVLWTERYDTFGRPTVISGFTDLELDRASLAPDGIELSVMNIPVAVVSEPVQEWCTGLRYCPEMLAGMPLVAHASSEVGNRATMRLVYSDGFRSISVCWTEGLLAADGATRVHDDTPGMPEVEVWQAGDGVVSVATNGGLAVLDRAVSALPPEEAWQPTLLERFREGLARVGGIN
ncbi:hypothetical protein GCM10028820_18820 [Tessaracoccus terricola]